MQHYGWPTEFIDATGSVSTAAFFARCGARGIRERGAVAVFDVARLMGNGVIVNLSEHPTARRARWQQAYGIWHGEHRNLKDPQAVSEMGIKWYAFRADPRHDARVARGKELLSVLDDETAGLLRLEIDGAIEQHGKVSHPVAKYLAERVAHCPVMMRKSGGLITPSEANIAVNDQDEEDISVRVWSRDHPDVVTRPSPDFQPNG